MLVWSRTQPRLENLCEGEDELNREQSVRAKLDCVSLGSERRP